MPPKKRVPPPPAPGSANSLLPGTGTFAPGSGTFAPAQADAGPAASVGLTFTVAGAGPEVEVQGLPWDGAVASASVGPALLNDPGPEAPDAGACTQDDFVTVVVTPKLSFQLPKRPEWHTVQDISQDELRRGFLSRFPPALWMSSEKFSFKPASPPTSQITKETRTLIYKIVSDDMPDDRVMLGILRELEKSYEAIIRRAVTETRSEAMHEQFMLQEQVEEARREQAQHVKDLKKDNKSLRDQLQSIQKRLFLVEQEKDQLQKEQHTLKDSVGRLDRGCAEQAKSSQSGQDELARQLQEMRAMLEASVAAGAIGPAKVAERGAQAAVASSDVPASGNVGVARGSEAKGLSAPAGGKRQGVAAPPASARAATCKANASSQTETAGQGDAGRHGRGEDVESVSLRVDRLQQQFGMLQGWMLQGSHMFQLANGVAAGDSQKS